MIVRLATIFWFGLCMTLLKSNIFGQERVSDKVEISWRTSADYDGKDNLGVQLILKNTSNTLVDLRDWDLWFNSMYPIVEEKTDLFQLTNENGNLFRIAFFDQEIPARDSLVCEYRTQSPIKNISTVPNGFYFQSKRDIKNYLPISNVIYHPIIKSPKEYKAFYEALYEKNERLNQGSDFSPIFPTPKSIKYDSKSYLVISDQLNYYVDSSFKISEAIVSKLQSLIEVPLINSSLKTSMFKILYDNQLAKEAYKLHIDDSGIKIFASTNEAVFYAMQSLFSCLLYSSSMNSDGKIVLLPHIIVNDEPRYGYRGFMLDIARNFKDKEVVKKYLDIMATYKLNVFHFHLIDDEGWRLEIPSLPELTEVGAKRTPSFKDGNSILPAYGSGATDINSHYLTKEDFIEILKYANERFITVVPEIETPGHSRAAIKSMQARYERLKAIGKVEEGEKYLLHDINDKSVYNSAQNFNDNVLNPALPSVYTFINQVLDEIKMMYAEAGLNLSLVSLGGDEVPNGVWEGSPRIQELMKQEGFTSIHQVWPYYINRINEICQSKGLNMAGWEEIGMINKGKGMQVNEEMKDKTNLLLDVWNNVIGGGQEDLAYRLANAGYPTVLLSASNMYFDMMWSTDFKESGLSWATYADLYHSYSLLPEHYFANIDTYYSGKAWGKKGFKDRVRLSAEGKKNLKGIKGGLFAETIHSEEKLDYMVFPRFFALAERAWSPQKDYESEDTFDSAIFDIDYRKFINRLGKVDLPQLSHKFSFRLPSVGVKLVGGAFQANIEYPGFSIHYTTDGTIPTLQSSKYVPSKGVQWEEGVEYIFVAIDKYGRSGAPTYFK